MHKKLLLLGLILFFQSNFSSTFAHVIHYQELNRLEFDLYRNNQLIGQHIYSFVRNGQNLKVNSEINFQIKKFGVTVYKYFASGEENYINEEFYSFSATTIQNKKKKFCNIYKKEGQFFIEGSSYKGRAPPEGFIIGTWWNHSIIDSKSQISAVSGRIIEQNVKYIGKEILQIDDKEFTALRFNFSSSDQSLSKNKRMNIDVWYDEKSLIWLKASFKKKGYWEYRLKKINRGSIF